VRQQIRQATAWGKRPRFLIHDNDGTFGHFREHKRCGEKGRRYRCHLDFWLADVLGIEGIPIPYGAPNASPCVERLNRTLCEAALNQFIFLNAKHVRRVCAEYRDLYNGGRPSQALHAIPDPYPELKKPPPATGKVVALPVLGGAQRDYRRAAWTANRATGLRTTVNRDSAGGPGDGEIRSRWSGRPATCGGSAGAAPDSLRSAALVCARVPPWRR
jgi:hypothetical protein